MKSVTIEQLNNGFAVHYIEGDERGANDSTYVYMATQDLLMLEKIAEKFLKRRVRIEDK